MASNDENHHDGGASKEVKDKQPETIYYTVRTKEASEDEAEDYYDLTAPPLAS